MLDSETTRSDYFQILIFRVECAFFIWKGKCKGGNTVISVTVHTVFLGWREILVHTDTKIKPCEWLRFAS